MKYIALFISRLFDIYIVFSLILLIIALNAGYSSLIDYLWLLLYFVILVLIPVVGDLFLLRNRRISDWDLSIRKERIEYINLDAFLMLMLLLISLIFHAPIGLLVFSVILFSIELLYGIITLFWKISVHAQLATLFAVYSSILIFPIGLVFLVIIPIVYWARMYLKMHTFLQLLYGTLVSGVITLIIMKLFGYY